MQAVYFYAAERNRHETEDIAPLDGDVNIADVMLELILPCVFLKKSVELGVARAK